MSLLKAIESNKKRKRVELKIEQKWEIIEYKKKYPKLSQTQLILHFNREFDTVISKQTMSDMLKPEYERRLQKLDSVEDYNTRIRDGKWPELEKCLYIWHSEMLSHNLPVSDLLIKEKAEEYANILGIIFNYSDGWLDRFKKRHNLKQFIIVGESKSVSIDLVDAARERSKKVIIEFALKFGWHNVWNLDETALFYKLLPSSS